MPRVSRPLAILALLTLLGACSDSSSPNDSTIAGGYVATALTITGPGLHPVDYLAGGSSLTLTIAADSTVTGRLLVPATVTGGAPIDIDMAGRALPTATTIAFDQTEESFVRHLTFSRHSTYLQTDETLTNGARYQVRLDRAGR
jgi:hypothetical protein